MKKSTKKGLLQLSIIALQITSLGLIEPSLTKALIGVSILFTAALFLTIDE